MTPFTEDLKPVVPSAAAPSPASQDDRKPSFPSTSASPRSPRSTSQDHKPSLPPPYPFASTSASIDEIDEKRLSGSEQPSGSGASTPSLEEDEEEVKSLRRNGTGKAKGKKKKVESEPQLIGHLPSAEEAAGRTYTEIADCTYASKNLGNMAYYDEDATQCECTYTAGFPDEEQACGDHSSCVNRLMQIECVKGECRTREPDEGDESRFQKKQYAPIEIVQTEKKGFGVRAMADIPASVFSPLLLLVVSPFPLPLLFSCSRLPFLGRTGLTTPPARTHSDAFVYEYVGEVIGPGPFAKKMKDYANEGIKHFYFMALDREVFIDATKKGGKGRFLNHSCNPNCYVAKWTIGRKMRMGIFTKRAIAMHEELTFNYNVDRYGHVAQECFCGEPNCVGFIGGKTQTDIGGMDDLYIDALGITEEVEALGLKGSKKKKGRKLDEDFVPTLHPIQYDEVPKVSAAIRQAIQTRRILEKLLTRVQMTSDEEVQRQLLRLHGLTLMNHILKEYPNDLRILSLRGSQAHRDVGGEQDLEILSKWKFQTRNKIETSKIEDQIRECAENGDESIRVSAKAKRVLIAIETLQLLSTWGDLQLGFRIPKAARDPNEDPDRKRASDFDIEQMAKRARLDNTLSDELFSRSTFVRPEANLVVPTLSSSRKLPSGWVAHRGEDLREYYQNVYTNAVQWDFPTSAAVAPAPKPAQATLDANALIAEAERAAREVAEKEARRLEDEKKERDRARQERHQKKRAEKDEKARAARDKKVMGLFSAVVVGTMSKYKAQFEPEAFKKRAREVTQILCDKEKKRPTYTSDSYDSLSSVKEAKVKSFVKDWVKKLLERKSKGGRASTSSSSTPRAKGPASVEMSKDEATASPATPGGGDDAMAVDSPDVDLDSPRPGTNTDGNGAEAGGSGTPPGTPPSLRAKRAADPPVPPPSASAAAPSPTIQ
ncbi:SPOSA6832_04507, partial [Sporobolomyces salmonicolor]